MIDSLIEIVSYLVRNKLRTILTAFGIFWGVFMLILMLGFGNGLKNGVFDTIDIKVNSFFVWTRPTTLPYDGFQKGRRYNFNLKDIEILKNRVSGIEYIAPRVELDEAQQLISRNGKVFNFSVYGDMPDIFKIRIIPLIHGRYFNSLDIENKEKVCVIGKVVQESLFEEDEDPIGQYIKVYNSYFKIVGVYDMIKGDEDDNNEIYLPFTTFSQVFNTADIVYWFSIKVYDQFISKAIMDESIKVLKRQHHISPEDEQAVGYFDLGDEFTKIDNLFTGINLLIWIVGLGTLIAGAVGVTNIMLVTITERTKEIGVKRAIGAKPRHIMQQIISESIFLTFLSGYIGLFISTFLLEGINSLISGDRDSVITRPGISFEIAISSLILLVVVGTIAGIIPTRRALKIKPIEALKDE